MMWHLAKTTYRLYKLMKYIDYESKKETLSFYNNRYIILKVNKTRNESFYVKKRQ